MIGGCVKRVLLLVLLLGLLVGAWLFREPLLTAWHELRGDSEAQEERASAEVAAAAARKLDALRDGGSTRVALSSVELESLLLFHYRGVLPAFLDSTRIELAGDELELRARVPIDNVPDIGGLGEAASFLPDTTEIAVTGKLLPLDSGRVAFAVESVGAAGFPLPARLVPRALSRIGRRDEPGLPADAIAVRLPAGIAAAYIRSDSLVLLSRQGAR
ncbi:MAG: hypothetical protein WD054_07195 [Gemmatimonadota bacterium]